MNSILICFKTKTNKKNKNKNKNFKDYLRKEMLIVSYMFTGSNLQICTEWWSIRNTTNIMMTKFKSKGLIPEVNLRDLRLIPQICLPDPEVDL